MTSKLLHCSTTPTMFFPMSCTSPLTVAITTVPLDLRGSPSLFSSMKGIRYATAFFITRALFTTCGRNILPEPNRSPTTFIPSISGSSITSSGRLAWRRASSVSSSTNSAMPLTSACSSLFPTGQLLHSRPFSSGPTLPWSRYFSARTSRRAVEEYRVDGLPYRVVAPERERDVRDAARGLGVGEGRGDLTHRLDKVNAVVVVLLDAGGDGEDIRVEDDVLGGETDLLCEDTVGTFAYADLPLLCAGLASFVEGHYDHRGTVALQ